MYRQVCNLGHGDIGKNVNTSDMYLEENKTYKILWNPRSVIREENHIYISVKDRINIVPIYAH